jgi:hypothetical protein
VSKFADVNGSGGKQLKIPSERTQGRIAGTGATENSSSPGPHVPINSSFSDKDRQDGHESSQNIAISAALEWSISSLRASLRRLMDPPVFEELMAAVIAFAHRPTAQRFGVDANVHLYHTLKALLGNDSSTLHPAALLCSQLAALEGLRRVSADLMKLA